MATRYFYILSGGKTRGPFPEKGILHLAAQGKLPPDAQLSENGQTWTAAELILPPGSIRPAEPRGPSADGAVPSRPPSRKQARLSLPTVRIPSLNRQTATLFAALTVFVIVLILLALVTARQVLIARTGGGDSSPARTAEEGEDWFSRGGQALPEWEMPPVQTRADTTMSEMGRTAPGLPDAGSAPRYVRREAHPSGDSENGNQPPPQPSHCADSNDWLERVQLASVMIITDQGQGSGFFIQTASGDALIVTNHHVVKDSTLVLVRLFDGTLKGVTRASAYPEYDLAFLTVDDLQQPPAILSLRSELPQLTEKVFAYGAPLGFSGTVTEGIVSAVRTTEEIDRTLEKMGGPATQYDHCIWIQTTAPISPGNSGGPLVDDRGRVVGVNTLGLHPELLAQNLNFAVSAQQITAILPRLRLESFPPSQSLQSDDNRRGAGRSPTDTESGNATLEYWRTMKYALHVWLDLNEAMSRLKEFPASKQIEVLVRFHQSCLAMIAFLNELEDANVDPEAIQCKEAICEWMDALAESLVSLASDPENPLVAARVMGQLERTKSALARAEHNARTALSRRYGIPFPILVEQEE
ncbi:MAG: S1C family serine protease [Thermogutta sp.]